jgi:hypothetical protein
MEKTGMPQAIKFSRYKGIADTIVQLFSLRRFCLMEGS